MKRKLRIQYMGLRLNGNGEDPSHAFRHGKETLYWSKLSYPVIGSFYEAVRDEKSTLLARRQWPKNPPDDFKIPQEWIDADAAAREYKKKRADHARVKRLVGEIWKEVKPLHERARKLSTFEKWAFADAVRRMIVTGKFVFLLALLTSCGKDTSCRIRRGDRDVEPDPLRKDGRRAYKGLRQVKARRTQSDGERALRLTRLRCSDLHADRATQNGNR